MSQTIPGGAYQDAAGGWKNAAGEPLKSDQVARFQEVAAQRQQRLALAEQQRMTTEASGNPIANALLQVLGLRSSETAAPSEPEQNKPARQEAETPRGKPRQG